MKNIRDYLKHHILLADGATGTYISSLLGRNAPSCELLNLSDPALVLDVHRRYLAAGSKLIGTNTFAANTFSLRRSRKQTDEILRAGFTLARRAAGENAFVAADIGPVPESESTPEQLRDEYRAIVDVFLSEGVGIFLFETFASPEYPLFCARRIREKQPDAYILIDYTVTSDGFSRLNLTGDRLIRATAESGLADASGFNCGSGPAQLVRYAAELDYGGLTPSLMPNAGYPEMENDFFLYSGSPAYFAGKLNEAVKAGIRIVGGCCGTTPEHIRSLAGLIECTAAKPAPIRAAAVPERTAPAVRAPLFPQRKSAEKTFIAELDPPFTSDLTKLEQAALLLRANGVDAVTIADSPMARPRMDSVAAAARLRRTAGIEAVPHITCRDRNRNALRSSLLAAHMEGIRHILAVTGDPVPETDRGSVKGVYDLNAAGLCAFVNGMNGDVFAGDPLFCGCAFNANARNPEQELRRLEKKVENGAAFLLSQPAFTQRAGDALRAAKALGIKIAAGIIIPVSLRNAMFLANEMPGIALPTDVLARFSDGMSREEGERAGIGAALEAALRLADTADGYYIIAPFNRAYLAAALVREIRRALGSPDAGSPAPSKDSH